MNEFVPTPIEVPTLAEITKLYNRAVDASDEMLRQTASDAIRRLAVAEASAAEAATLVGFLKATNR